ncbi:beta strand repeat-containing protein [Spirosoma validum]|uniref:Right handed beta helix domain-containing protein n=1 Tax=Spirosoma validum TaxID=2771355 RepID=A0A927B6D0_9BACT|nr:hypothetical protein [Spirosoma validum]MBD2756133.1 hypothetical protein [Spirosoma validum]
MMYNYTPDSGRLRSSQSDIAFRKPAWATTFLGYTFSKLASGLLATFLGLVLFAGQSKADDVYLSAGGSGTQTGNSWNNAKDFNTYFNTFFPSAGAIPAGTHIYIKAGNYSITPAQPAALNANDILIQGGFPLTATGVDKSGYNPLANITKITSTGGFVGTNGSLSASTNVIELKGIEFGGAGSFYFGNIGAQGTRGTFKFTDLNIHNVSGQAVFFQANGSGSSASFTNCLFANNINGAGGGAAISNPPTNLPLTIVRCSFTGNNNSAGSANGGGAIFSESNLTISDSYFCDNTSYVGGAIGVPTVGSVNPVYTVTNSTFYHNRAILYGGAIGLSSGSIDITGCKFYDNISNGSRGGGGICVVLSSIGTVNTVDDCMFYNNGTLTPVAPYGGGAISLMQGGSSNYQITNSKFVKNYVNSGYGGAICYDNNGGTATPTISGCLFYDNKANGGSTGLGADLGIRYGTISSYPRYVVNSSKLQLAQSAYLGFNGGGSGSGTNGYVFGTGPNVNTFSNTTDDGGIGTPTFSCPTSINAVAVNIEGQVWDDVNGNVTFEGSENGTNAGGPLFVNLVDGTGTVIASTTVSASGSYTLAAPTSTTGLKLVLTNTATATAPGPLPSQWVNTGENVGSSNSATQSATLGQIELSIGTTAITAQNFGIEHLPTPGSGTATVSNAGGTTPVTVPPSAFTSTSPSSDTGDTPPGSVTAIHITTFPSNVTSLTINGTVYTSIPGGGITVPTDGNGAPTVPILVDPTNDSQPVSFTFTAIDNAGKESTTTGTAVLLPAPDLTPIIYARPSSVYNTTDLTVVVDVVELLGVPTSGLITVRVTKDARVNLVFIPSTTLVGGRSVSNSVWNVDLSNPSYYTLSTSQPIGAGDKLSFGFTGTLTPGATTGVLTLSSVILGGSGGEVRVNNNVDADKIDYFQQ